MFFGIVINLAFRSKSQNRRHDIYLQYSPNANLNKDIINRFWRLPLPECRLQITYVWIDGTGENLRSKDRVFTFLARKLKGTYYSHLIIL